MAAERFWLPSWPESGPECSTDSAAQSGSAKSIGFYVFICALKIRGPLGGHPRLSVSFTGASGGIPDAPGTEYKQNQETKT